MDELKEQENILQQCVVQLESSEATRAALVSQLKEAVLDQVQFHYFFIFIFLKHGPIFFNFFTIDDCRLNQSLSGIKAGTCSRSVAGKIYYLLFEVPISYFCLGIILG